MGTQTAGRADRSIEEVARKVPAAITASERFTIKFSQGFFRYKQLQRAGTF